MICKTCARAADSNSPDMHSLCKGCDCHHMVVTGFGNLVPAVAVKRHFAEVADCRHCARTVGLYNNGVMRAHKEENRPGARWCKGTGRQA